MRRALWAVACVLLGCAELPVPSVGRSAAPEGTPTVVGPRGRLVEAQADRMLERIESRSAADDILQRHVAEEEEIAGMPLSAGNRVTLLQDGPSTYASMFDAIEAARDHINVEFYIIEDDEVGQRFARRLIERAAEGIAIRVIYDSVGSLATPSAFFDDLRRAGIQVVEFNPVNPLEGDQDWNVNNRDHRKVVVVDGRIAFLGGINISGVYSRGSAPGRSGGSAGGSGASRGSGDAGWRDTNVRIEGPAVAQIQLLFLNTWMRQGGGALRERDWFPRPLQRGDDLVRVIGSEAGGEAPAIYLTLLSVIEHAEHSVHLTMAYFVPDEPTLEALMRAARRGVDVKIIVPSRSDFWAVFYAGRASYARLMRAGVKLYERQGTLLHAKTAVIDGVWSTVGSSNIDTRSFLHNNEINAVVLGTGFAAEMRAMFERDLGLSKRIDADTWGGRGLRDRALELAARVWSYWL